MSNLYPLKFKTIFKEKIWGGQKIKEILGKSDDSLTNCGETWEISALAGNVSEVSNGFLKGKLLTDLVDEYTIDLLGDKVFQKVGSEFPLLIKFIDAAKDLSIQVHPDDELAKKRHDCLGKTEMWYVMDADPEAKLTVGFKDKIDSGSYLHHIKSGTLNDILNVDDVKKGDVYYIPTGRVHSIGKGVFLTEIQQTSDVTYRIYDFDRKDFSGKKRQLHLDEAIDAMDYEVQDDYKTSYERITNKVSTVKKNRYFATNHLPLDSHLVKRDYTSLGSFVIHICTEGEYDLNYTNENTMKVKKGDVVLIPASIKQVVLEAQEAHLLEVYVPCD